jgi:hypothetical protein
MLAFRLFLRLLAMTSILSARFALWRAGRRSIVRARTIASQANVHAQPRSATRSLRSGDAQSFRAALALAIGALVAMDSEAHPRQRSVDLGTTLSRHATINVLSNGNTVVCDPNYSTGTLSGVGAVWIVNMSGVIVSRITGSQAGDHICGTDMISAVGDVAASHDGINLLPNGHFVVASPLWHCLAGAKDCGAVTWVDADIGLGASATLSSDNSLVGAASGHSVGTKVTVLRNSDYLVSSLIDPSGALTMASGRGGSVGLPSDNTTWKGVGALLA